MIDEIKKALHAAFPEAKSLLLDYDGKMLHLRLQDKSFEGLSAVKAQQRVYQVLNPWILSKELHAVKLDLSF